MLRQIFVIALILCLPVFKVQAIDFVVDDFSDLSDWQGEIVKDEKNNYLGISGYAVKEVQQDWSGYTTFELNQKDISLIQVTLIDADDEHWVIEVNQVKNSFDFSEFQLSVSSRSGDKTLSTGNIKNLIIEGDTELTAIGLSGSKGFNGPNVYIQTSNKYFAGKSWDKVAAEIKGKGFTAVHLTPVELTPSTYYKQKEMVDAFHKVNMPVALAIYPGTDFYAYSLHPEWHQRFLEGGGSSWDWRVYNCLREEEFILYTIDYLKEQFLTYGYDALHISEPWLEVWGGPKNPQYYSCFCDRCRTAFIEQSGVDPLELFNTKSDYYYTKNDSLYQEWIDFRVETVASFLEKIIGGLKEAKPEVPAFVMFLSDITVEPGKTRVYQAMDLERFAEIGDAVIIETAWQDWTRKDIWPGYILTYGKEYTPRVFEANPLSSIYAQPDVGSNWDEMHRSPKWLRDFSAYAARSGFDGYIVYEYSQMGYRMLPTTKIILDDFEKIESSKYWTTYNLTDGEVLSGRVGNTAYEGEGSLLIYYSGVTEGLIGAEKDVMLDLTGFDRFELKALFDEFAFVDGEKITLFYEVVTAKDVYKATEEIVVKSDWQEIVLPFENFGDTLNLSHVKKLRIGVKKDENMSESGRVFVDLFGINGTRRSFLNGQGLPITQVPKPTTEIVLSNLEIITINKTPLDLEKGLFKLDLEIRYIGGPRSVGSIMADIVVYDEATGKELPKLSRSYRLGTVRKETEGFFNTTLTLPKGRFIVKTRLYVSGLDYLDSQEPATLIGELIVEI